MTTTQMVPCTLPNCDGYFHADGGCSAIIGREVITGNAVGELDVELELCDTDDDGVYVSVLGLVANDSEAILSRLRSREEALALAARFTALAKAIEDAGSQLAAFQAGRAAA